jgi:predicted permease
MKMLRAWLLRFGGLFGRQRRDRELAAELDSHLQLHIDDNLRAGMTPEEARRRALIKLGGVEQTKEKYREQRGIPWLESLWQDIRFGLRLLRKNPGFAIVAVMTLALGIGANTAIFNLLRTVVFPSLPVSSPNEVFVLHGIPTPNDGAFLYSQPAWQHLNDSTAGIAGTARLAAHSGLSEANLAAHNGDPTQRANLQLVSTNFFQVLRVSASLGRLFNPEDSRQSPNGWSAILRYNFWRKYFGGDSHVLGSSQILNGALVSIIGVASPDFDGVIAGQTADFWLPLEAQHDVRYVGPFDSPGNGSTIDLTKPYDQQSSLFWLTLIGRVSRGKTNSALAAWNTAFESDRELYARFAPPAKQPTVRNAAFTLLPAASSESSLSGHYAEPLFVLMGMVGLLLMIAGLNLANLLRTRTLQRTHEFAIRAALGASRVRVLQQMAAESVPLSLCGGLLSLVVAYFVGQVLLRWSSDPVTQLNLHFGVMVYVFCFALLVATMILFQVLPTRNLLFPDALSAAELTSARGLVTAERGRRTDIMLGTQIALCVLLLSVAAMFIRTLKNLNDLNAGLDREHVLTIRFDFFNSGIGNEQLRGIYPQMLDRVRSLPGIRFAAQDMCPPPNCLWNTPIYAAGSSSQIEAHQDDVGAGYFRALGIQMLSGREFDDGDRPTTTQVAVVNHTLAARLFGPGESAVGRRLGFGKSPEDSTYLVVGEIADARVTDLRSDAPPMIYLPVAQKFPTRGSLELRTVGEPSSAIPNVRAALLAFDPHLPIAAMMPLNVAYGRTLQTERLLAKVTSAFGILALLLAAVGLYGVQSFRVARRTSEIGVRIALGANPADVLWLLLRRGFVLTSIGLAVGSVAAMAAARLFGSMFFGVTATDPITLATVTGILGITTLLAIYIPARRATHIDPSQALRHE